MLIAPTRNWEDLEIDLLLQGIYHRYGFDFREYKREPLRNKLRSLLHQKKIASISALQDKILHDTVMGEAFLCELNVRSVPLFDDPEHIGLLRKVAVPWLRSHPAPKIWLADCASAEEICTLAIMLEEENLYDKTQIFATSSNESMLHQASSTGVALEELSTGIKNHRQSGGQKSLSQYFSISGKRAVMLPRLRANITWAQFNMQTDASFNEFQLIICRRVLSDFQTPLQHRVLNLFHESMPMFGLLSIDDSTEIAPPFSNWYRSVSSRGNVYKRVA